jgi:transcriptional regulator with XRE-family HTH domain
MNNVFRNIRKIREMRDLTQKQVAEKLKISDRSYNDLENGRAKNVTMQKLDAIAKILEVETKDLLAADFAPVFFHCKESYVANTITIQQNELLNQTVSLLKEVLQELRQQKGG